MRVNDEQIVRVVADHSRKLERLETLPQGGSGGGGGDATIESVFNQFPTLSVSTVIEKRVFFTGTIIRWSVVGFPSGSIRFFISKSTFAAYPTLIDIYGTDPPQLVNAYRAESVALTGWSTGITTGDILRFQIDQDFGIFNTIRAVVSLECSIP
jgi:hypothetical protein